MEITTQIPLAFKPKQKFSLYGSHLYIKPRVALPFISLILSTARRGERKTNTSLCEISVLVLLALSWKISVLKVVEMFCVCFSWVKERGLNMFFSFLRQDNGITSNRRHARHSGKNDFLTDGFWWLLFNL